MFSGALGFLSAVLFAGTFQDPPPKPPDKPPQEQPKPAEAPKLMERPSGEILYQIGKFKRPDGLVSLCYKVGFQRGRLLKAILEGQTLHIPGQPAPIVSVTPDKKSRILSDKGHALESEEAHLLIVTDVEENIPYLEAVLKMLDVPDPQVLIEARIVELRWDSDLQYGLEGEGASSVIYTLPGGSDAFLKEIRAKFNPSEAQTPGPFQGSTFRFGRTSSHQGTLAGILQAFVQRGQAEILSTPRILASNGREALVLAGERVPYSQQTNVAGAVTTTINYEDANLQLKVRPHIVGSNFIQLEIDTSIKSLTDVQQPPGADRGDGAERRGDLAGRARAEGEVEDPARPADPERHSHLRCALRALRGERVGSRDRLHAPAGHHGTGEDAVHHRSGPQIGLTRQHP